MKKIVEEKVVSQKVIEEEGGPVTLLGEYVYISCASYAYYGKLIGVNATSFQLEDPYIVYETGPWTADKWKDAQKLPFKEFFIGIDSYESMGSVEKKV